MTKQLQEKTKTKTKTKIIKRTNKKVNQRLKFEQILPLKKTELKSVPASLVKPGVSLMLKNGRQVMVKKCHIIT
jgi:hypothetical protein